MNPAARGSTALLVLAPSVAAFSSVSMRFALTVKRTRLVSLAVSGLLYAFAAGQVGVNVRSALRSAPAAATVPD